MQARCDERFDGYRAADAECENCGRRRRFRGRELRAYATMGHTVESFGRKLSCQACRERGAGYRNVNLVMRPVLSR